MMPVSLIVILAGCKGSGDMELADATTAPAPSGRTVALRIDVIPSDLRAANGTDYRAMPQSLLPGLVPVGSPLDIGDVTLSSPIVQTGNLAAFKVNPSIAALPGDSLPLAGSVALRRANTIQWYLTETDDLGNFSLWTLPGRYQLEVIPDDPLLPMLTTEWTIGEVPEPIVLDLEAGAPIYGRVLSPSGPIAGAQVHVENSSGARSVSATTDDYGFYQIRVAPGEWTLVSEGRGNGWDPVLRFGDLDVEIDGLNQDILYPVDLPQETTAFLQGQILHPSGERLDNATVRVIAESIDGYEDLDASFEASDSTEVGAGSFIVSVVPGSYTIEVMPPSEEFTGEILSPLRLTGVRVDQAVTTLEPLSLGGARTITGIVRGPSGASLGSARVDCTEVGFDGRTWYTFSEKGEFSIEVSDVEIECKADPPGDRTDLARVWRTIAPSTEDPSDGQHNFDLPEGERITGTVFVGDKPEAFVVVDVLDSAGRSLGSGLTLDDGIFSVPVDLQSAK